MSLSFTWFFIILHCCKAPQVPDDSRYKIVVVQGVNHRGAEQAWLNALAPRMSSETIDSIKNLRRSLTSEEAGWQDLIVQRSRTWPLLLDSLSLPFPWITIPDTVFVHTGYGWSDDAFTFGMDTVCLDLTALQTAYGNAGRGENSTRIDRLFSHEFTHLLSKQWLARQGYVATSFADSVLWECWYEGLGLYRSLSQKWLPVSGVLPGITTAAMDRLVPVFNYNMALLQQNNLDPGTKARLRKNLSRGKVEEKWGAFPVAIWLASEANGNDRRLRQWVQKGPEGIPLLAKTYIRQ